MPWAAAGAVVGGLLASSGSKSVANSQAGAARDASAAQERMFERQVELQKPFRDVGLSANNRLAYLLGLTTSPSSETGLDYESLRKQLTPEYTKKVPYTRNVPRSDFTSEDPNISMYTQEQGFDEVIDQNALDAEINRRLAEQAAIASGDSQYGSLLRDFSMADFEADPGYAFRQAEGLKGIEGGAAARGGLLSGGALKAIQKYGQDLASQEYGNAYGRFNANQTNKYNRLAGLVNTGQGATNQITNAAGNLGSQLGSNIIGAGNAQAAGQVGSANAWNQAIGGVSNAYQNNQLMNMIRNPGGRSAASLGSTPTTESYYGY